MRYFAVLLLGVLCGLAQAQEVDDLRLIQAHVHLPTLQVWLNLTADTQIEREQFNISVGPHPAKVLAIDPFLKTGEGVGYIFLVDISKSLNSRQLVQIKRSLHRWLEGMGPHDQAALITFGHEVTHTQEFTNDRFRLNNAIGLLATRDMETSLYHGLLEAISLGRSQVPGLPSRRAIVVLSDGIDDSLDGVSMDEVFKQNSEYRVPIYSIGFAVQPINDSKREGLKVLGMLSRQSGGYFVQADPEQLDNAYETQHQLISQAYRLRIVCPDCVADGQLHHIDLTWSDGQRTLNDGFDMRLLPQKVVASRPHNSPPVAENDAGWSILIFAVAVLAFFLGLALVYRQRLAQPKQFIEENAVSPPAPATITKPAPGLLVKLTVVSGVQKGRNYQLNVAERVTLGRAGQCDLCLDDDVEISSQHALLQNQEGKLSARDLNSTNGTLVNGVPIHNDYPLRSGDLLLLGRTELRVEL
ncbi:MAG: FHA domain-containing protein [Methylomonas sp.]|jgi:hypothetical protein|uniref:FHA domain-containing protein n=1 Tax=Methylomonas sp. TaxID=418 RepID=UPI0025F3CE3C|nr:FHA domain-containing protein [Methylomonas sp.]MCK9608239.1 FHA domain-containing protein [Methylomonas sp.]